MSNVIGFPLNLAQPSNNLLFNARAVLLSETFRQWMDEEISDEEFFHISHKMLPGNVPLPSGDEFNLTKDDIMKMMKSKEFKQVAESKEFMQFIIGW